MLLFFIFQFANGFNCVFLTCELFKMPSQTLLLFRWLQACVSGHFPGG